MSTGTTVNSTNNSLQTNYDTTKIFLWNNRYANANYTNDSYADETLAAGTVMGRIAATGEVVPVRSNNTDGSQFPIGILAADYAPGAGETQQVSLCVFGDVAENKLIFTKSGDDLDTVVSGKTYRDLIGSDTVGVLLRGGDQLTAYDNS